MGFPRVYLTKPLSLFGPINIASDAVRPNQAIIASFAVWLNQAIMAEWQMAMAKSPEVDSQESSVGLGQPLAMATDEFVNVKLPDESPQTWQCLVDHVAACFGQLCDAYGGACSTSTTATRTKLRVNSSAIGSTFSWCLRSSRVT